MAKQVRIRAIYKKEVDVQSCVLALLALARQLQEEAEATAENVPELTPPAVPEVPQSAATDPEADHA